MQAAAADGERDGLDEALNDAAMQLDVKLCSELIAKGANPRKVFRKGKNEWYDGDSSTCLYNAIQTFRGGDRLAEERFVDTLDVLLKAGADADFSAQVGGWNRCTHYSLFSRATDRIVNLNDGELRKRAMGAFVSAGVNPNEKEFRGKQGNCGGYGSQRYAVFDIARDGNSELLALFLDAGVNPNCAESSWSVQFGDSDSDENAAEGDEGEIVEKEHTPLLHAAIISGNLELVRLLLDKGANVNQNMVFTWKRKSYLISSLQLACEQGDTEIMELLTRAGAQKEVTDPLVDVVRMFNRFGDEPSNEEGKWTLKQKQESGEGRKKSKGKRKGPAPKGRKKSAPKSQEVKRERKPPPVPDPI